MADTLDCYPPPPASVPPNVTRPSPGYRARVLLVLASLLLFVALYLGLVVGSGYLCYYAFVGHRAAEQQRAAGWRQVQAVSRAQSQLVNVFNNAVAKAQSGALDKPGLLLVLERDVLPQWRIQRERLDRVQGLPADEQRFVQLCQRYLKVQEEGWELYSRALRDNDGRLFDQFKQRGKEADQLARQISGARVGFRGRVSPDSGEPGFWLIILGIASGVLCLFLVKGLFKRQRLADPSLRVEVTEAEQPVLFAFLRRLCQDTGAPRPHRVYLTPDVNAAVFYHQSFLSLLLPTPKNLVIGLGLVNRLNLSEFKAVLAHEFGHFSQHSMKLGSYVYTSNRIIGEVVFGRDWLDSVVAVLRGVDLRIAVFAWAFTGVLWGVRKTLQGLFRGINFASAALSRQMEFNADLVAVSVTGSDALVHGLARLDFAVETLNQACSDLTAAADHGLFTRDLFYHQTRAVEYLRGLRKDPRLGEPPALPADPTQSVHVFEPADTSVPRMWATHPSNHDRERNAKRQYVRSPLDERSPWVLFQDGPMVREQVTQRLYEVTRQVKDVKLEAPEVVQAFIDAEHAETTYDPRYHGLYDHRYLTPGNFDELLRSAPAAFADDSELARAHAELYGDEVKARMETHQARHRDYNRLAGLVGGAVALTGKDFQFRGGRYGAADAQRLLDQVRKELDQDYDWMTGLDRQVFLIHYSMARRVGEEVKRDLEDRYRFHLAVQEIHGRLSGHNAQVRATLAQYSGRPELTQDEFQAILTVLRDAQHALRENLERADELCLPVLKNMKPGEPLGPFLLSQPLLHPLSSSERSLNGDWIGRLLGQYGEVLDKAQRIHFKSLGGILALQERIAQRWGSGGA